MILQLRVEGTAPTAPVETSQRSVDGGSSKALAPAAANGPSRELTAEEDMQVKVKAKEELIRLTVEWDNPEMALWVLERYDDIGEDGDELDSVLQFALYRNRVSFIRWLLKMPTFR